MKRLLLLCLALISVCGVAACDVTAPHTTPTNVTPTAEEPTTTHQASPATTQSQTTAPPIDAASPESPGQSLPLGPIEEDLFVLSLDVTLLETIAAKIQSVVQMIQEKERADPEYVLQGRWNQDFRESAEYQYVLELGPKAVKPAYYIIYKSEYAGLYEYMIASAIDDITRYDYTVKQGFRWSNSKVFLETYNEKVVNTLAAFTSIMENRRLTEGDKLEEIRRLGVFVVAPLLSAIDDTFPGQPAGYLEDCLWSVVEDYTGERPACDLLQWRRENERAYREIVETLKL